MFPLLSDLGPSLEKTSAPLKLRTTTRIVSLRPGVPLSAKLASYVCPGVPFHVAAPLKDAPFPTTLNPVTVVATKTCWLPVLNPNEPPLVSASTAKSGRPKAVPVVNEPFPATRPPSAGAGVTVIETVAVSVPPLPSLAV